MLISAVSRQPSAVSRQPSAVSRWPLATLREQMSDIGQGFWLRADSSELIPDT
ncbi:hypothetical protein [Moorena sp. SIO4E2]|uniref:hypothetical protein n=1 Tax=Moorena sp. SIO4E2 TaxID=2607826 RepID=UPI002580FC38|nr:hypothetical protein [Moorena sp. SIO4E2]